MEGRDGRRGSGGREDVCELHDLVDADTLVKRDTDEFVVDPAQVNACSEGGVVDRRGILRGPGHVNGQRVEEVGVDDRIS